MQAKKFLRAFVFLFLVFFIIFNWNQISWVFNYQAVSGLVSDFLKEAKDIEFKKDSEADRYDYYDIENSVEIPKIEISSPLIIVENGGEEEVFNALNKGTVLFPGSALPGEDGQTIILGHSAPPGWPKTKYDWVFSEINELSAGDEVIVYFNQRKFDYIVEGKIFLERGEEIPENLTSYKNMLVLISCWPPGKDSRRIAVVAALKKE